MNDDLLELLNEAKEQLSDMWKMATDSEADYVLNIETAIHFINKALKTEDRLDIFKAIEKAYTTLKMDYAEVPENKYDKEYNDLVNKLFKYFNESTIMKKEKKPLFEWVNGNQFKLINEDNTDKLTTSERNLISTEFKKAGLDGNGRFEKKEYGLKAITDVLSSLGFQLDMISADMIMGDKGRRSFIFRRKNDPKQDSFTEKSEITNSSIVFIWERMDGPTFSYPNSPNKFEIIAYAS